MTLLFMDSGDVGDYAQKWTNNNVFVGWSSSTTTPFTAGRSLAKAGTAGGLAAYKDITASAEVVVGAFVNFTGIHADGAFPVGIFTFAGDAGAVEHVFLGSAGTANTLYVYRGSSIFSAPRTLLATIPSVAYGWRYIEFKAKIHDTTGSFEVKIDGVSVASATNVDTKNAGTSTNIDRVLLTGMSNGGTVTTMWDDVYILNTAGSVNNDFLGPHRIRTLAATGASATGGATGLTPSTGTNWSCIDEVPYSATDYVSGASGKDVYATSNVTPSGVTPRAVQVVAIAKRMDATPTSVKPLARSSSADYGPITQVLPLTDLAGVALFETDPAGGAWTESSVNALEIGVEVV